jgi:phosphate:Na+ symporter
MKYLLKIPGAFMLLLLMALIMSCAKDSYFDIDSSGKEASPYTPGEKGRISPVVNRNVMIMISGGRNSLSGYLATDLEELENSINGCRNRLKQLNISNLDQHVYSYDNGTVFSDLISEFEKNGDYIINVVESRLRATRNGIRFQGILIDTDSKTVTVDGNPVSFTKTEYELLKMFMMNRGRVYSREELLQAIWPDDVIVNTRTVDVNITRIRKKIEPYAEHLTTRAGYGYSFQE